MPTARTSDVLVIGGGVIGLSVAYQLARQGVVVTVVDRGDFGREASWAGAGVLPPASWYVDDPALDALALEACRLQPLWSHRLREDSGVDDEYWACGARYRATPTNAQRLRDVARRWRSLGVELTDDGCGGFAAPDEAQVRNPRRLRALQTACERRGVRMLSGIEVQRLDRSGSDRLRAVETTAGDFSADAYCLTAGCWTPALAETASVTSPGRPVLGQMLLLRPAGAGPDHILHQYPHYAVPRRDGLVLVGATVEDVGFDKRTTGDARAELIAAAAELSDHLRGAEIVRHWSGLRPASADRLPVIGRAPEVENLWIASGHHRSGLQLSPPTAQMVSAMIRGERCDLPTSPFDPARFDTPAAAARSNARLRVAGSPSGA